MMADTQEVLPMRAPTECDIAVRIAHADASGVADTDIIVAADERADTIYYAEITSIFHWRAAHHAT